MTHTTDNNTEPGVRTVATIEARMTSSRLPGKVLMPALGRPMLGHLVDRLKAVGEIDEIVLATTTNGDDDVLADFASRESISIYRGSEDDVMGRVIGAAASASADVVVEITGDCPIIDPDIVAQTIRMFFANAADYAGNAHVRSFPDGMDTQVYRLDTLQRSASMTNNPLDREHVTLHIRNHPDIFSHVHLVAPPALHWPELGLTLDEMGDYELLCRVIETLAPTNPLFGCGATMALLRANPDWLELNRQVVRKGDA